MTEEPSMAAGPPNAPFPYLQASVHQALRAMGSENHDRLLDLWRDRFDPLLALIGWATAPHDARLKEIEASVAADPSRSTLVLLTERGDDARQFSTAVQVGEICDRYGSRVNFVFSGGNYYSGAWMEFGEEAALAMMMRFVSCAPAGYDRRCTIDQASLHTGYQGPMLAGMIRALKPGRVVSVVPIEHVVRFMLTYNYDLAKLGLADAAQQFALGIGEWGRMLRRGVTAAEDAFGPTLLPGDPRVIDIKKRVGGEYGETMYAEVLQTEPKMCYLMEPGELCRLIGLPH